VKTEKSIYKTNFDWNASFSVNLILQTIKLKNNSKNDLIVWLREYILTVFASKYFDTTVKWISSYTKKKSHEITID